MLSSQLVHSVFGAPGVSDFKNDRPEMSILNEDEIY